MAPRLQRAMLIVGVTALFLDFVVPYSVAATLPTYSHTSQFMSEIAAAGPTFAVLMGAWWVTYGAALIAFAYALLHALPTSGAATRWAVASLAVAGLGLGVGGGVFPCDLGCSGLSTSGKLHSASALLGSLALVTSPFLISVALRSSPGWLWDSRAALVAAVIGLGVFTVFLIASRSEPDGDSTRGLWQRIFLAVYYVWLAGLALRCLRSLHRGPSRSEPAAQQVT